MPSLQVFCFAINQNKKNICIIDTVSDFYGFPREINTETEFVFKKKHHRISHEISVEHQPILSG